MGATKDSKKYSINSKKEYIDEQINGYKNAKDKKKKKDKDKAEEKEEADEKKISYFSLYKYADVQDKIFIVFATVFAIICGGLQPYIMILFGDVTGVIIEYAKHLSDNSTDAELSGYQDDLNAGIEDFALKAGITGVVTIVCTYLSGVLFQYSALRQIFRIRKLFFERTLNQDVSWYDVHKTGDFATTFTENLSKIEEGIGEKVAIFLFFVTVFVTGIIMGLVLGWKLALVCLVSLPLSTVIMGLIQWLSTKFSQQELEAYGAAGAVAEEALSSVRTVIAFEGQLKESERYDKHLVHAKSNNIRKNMFSAASNGVLWFFVYACYALSFWFGVGLILEDNHLPKSERVYTPENMVAVFFCTLIASWNFGTAAPYFEIFGAARGAASKVYDVLDNEPVINLSKVKGKEPTEVRGEIKFENVHFQYPSRPDVKILQGFTLNIRSGETVALVGSSGCGKSTCIQLIQRFYDAISGNVFIDDNNIKDLNLTWLRSKIGVVGQEPALFVATIAENIRYGNLQATQKDIERAAKKANAHNFIKSLPRGYQTMVGERGAQLSGGQKQRIAIARALVREPKILLLDEATSALDTTSEAEVQAALDAVSGECTTVIVAHRLSTIRNAHRIIVVADGQVKEMGTHAELMEAKGAYFTLVRSQGLSETDGDAESKGSESRRMVDITRDKPIKVAVRVVVPVRDHPKFNFVGKLLGPKGNSLKRLQEDTMCKMAVLGRGSMKDRHKEEELRASGDPKFQHLSEELHVEISAFATPAEAHARIAYALAEVRRFLVPDYNDDIRQEQMWEMQVLSSQRNNNKGDEASGGSSSGAEYSANDDRLSANDGVEPGPDSPQDEHPALRGLQQPGTPSSNDTTASVTPANGSQLSPTNGVGGTGGAAVGSGATSAASGVGGGRKRPLLAGGPRTSMTPTKRTVMSLLARARAAQAKQLPATFQRGTPERTTTLVPLLREDYITGAVNLNLI